eukprot:gene9993-10148_t
MRKPQWLKGRALGLVLIFLTAFIWVAASFISQLLVTTEEGRPNYHVSPFLLTYLSTSIFTIFLPLSLPDEEEANVALFFGYVGLLCSVVFAPVVAVLAGWGSLHLKIIPAQAYLIIFVEGILNYCLSDYLWAHAVLLLGPTVATLGLSVQIPVAAVVDVVAGHARWLSSAKAMAMTLSGTGLIMVGFFAGNLAGGGNVYSSHGNREDAQEACRRNSSDDGTLDAHAALNGGGNNLDSSLVIPISTHSHAADAPQEAVSINSLPTGALHLILSFLSARDLAACTAVCRVWCKLNRDKASNSLWKGFYTNRWRVTGTTGDGVCWQSKYGSKMKQGKSWAGKYEHDSLYGHKAGIKALKLLPSHGMLLTGSLDRTVRLWDLNYGMPFSISRPHGGTVSVLKYQDWVWSVVARGGLLLVASGPEVHVHDLATGKLVRKFQNLHEGSVLCLEGTHSGRTLFTGGADGLLMGHDLRMKDPSRALWHHNAGINGLALEDPWLVSAASVHFKVQGMRREVFVVPIVTTVDAPVDSED